ncbi:MAG: hypothetical protein K0R39_314 [Symbiobacteriaceae bacterium]|jgi:hypothetical protein|nr:hypothetical protein [Symbiobacteriaceae bacterium]
MKRLVSATITLIMILLVLTGCTSSGPAKEAGAKFFAAAAEGDLQTVQAMLSPKADITAQEVVDQYLGLKQAEAFDIHEALPNNTGVQYIVLASGVDRNGHPHSTSIAVSRENGTWVVVRAGTHFTY